MQNGSGEAKDPSSFLTEIIGGKVTVKLNSGIVYKGKCTSVCRLGIRQADGSTTTGELQSVDGYMNIALEDCKEFVNGGVHRNYGDVFLRGNNVMYICADH